MAKLRLVCISDTHGRTDFDLPDGDVLLLAGDFTMNGKIFEFESFNAYCGRIKSKFTKGIYITPGNHDFLAEENPTLAKQVLTNCNLLIDKAVTIENINFWLSPWQPTFYDWAFNLPRNGWELEAVWNQVPENTNVLITHGPPYGILDKTPDKNFKLGTSVGCEKLAQRLNQLKELKLHVFGHIHHSNGCVLENGVWFANSSICDERYYPHNKPFVFDIDTETKEIEFL